MVFTHVANHRKASNIILQFLLKGADFPLHIDVAFEIKKQSLRMDKK